MSKFVFLCLTLALAFLEGRIGWLSSPSLADDAKKAKKTNKPLDVLIKELRGSDPHISKQAADGIIEALRSAVVYRRYPATVFGKAEEAEIIAAAEGATEKKGNVTLAVIEAIVVIHPEATVAVPLLIQALKDKDKEIQITAISGLGEYRREAKEALLPLRTFLKDKDPDIRFATAKTLAEIDPTIAEVIPVL